MTKNSLFKNTLIFLILILPFISEANLACRGSIKTSSQKQSNSNNLYLVHATDTLPQDGILRAGAVSATNNKFLSDVFRPTLHFAIGDLVRPHENGNWENMKYAVLIPLHTIQDRIVSLSTQDTFILGDLKLPPEAIIVKKNSRTSLREEIRKVIRSQKSYVVESLAQDNQLSDVVQIQEQKYTEFEFLKAFQLLQKKVSRGAMAYAIEGDATLLQSLDTISQVLYEIKSGYPRERVEIGIYFEIGQKLIPQIEKWISKNGWLDSSVKFQLQTLSNQLKSWAQKEKWSSKEPLNLENVDHHDLSQVMRRLDPQFLEALFSRVTTSSRLSLAQIKIQIALLEIFGKKQPEAKWLQMLASEIQIFQNLNKEESSTDGFLFHTINEFFKMGYHPKSEYNKSLLEILSLPEVFRIYNDSFKVKKKFTSFRDFFSAALKIELEPGDLSQKEMRAVKILALFGQPEFKFESNEITSWFIFLDLHQQFSRNNSKYNHALKQIYEPLNTTDIDPIFDHYTVFSYYRDLYFSDLGPNNSNLVKRLKLNSQFSIDFPNRESLFKSPLSLWDIIKKYSSLRFDTIE
jgi:hypothetical protein